MIFDGMLKVLIVSEQRVIRDLVSRMLSNVYKKSVIEAVDTVSEANIYLIKNTPSVIIFDILSPSDVEAKFMATLRDNDRTKKVPVISLVQKSDNDFDELSMYRCRVNSVMTKPFILTDIAEEINYLLDIHDNPYIALLLSGQERQDLDFKDLILLNNKDERAALAKDVIAMSNWGGGAIFIGVSEPMPGKFEYTGLPDESLNYYETTRLNKAIRDFIDPPVHVASTYLNHDNKTFVMLSIPPSKDKLILAKKKNDNAQLYQGRIYTRNTSAESAEVQSSSELREIMQRIYTKEHRS